LLLSNLKWADFNRSQSALNCAPNLPLGKALARPVPVRQKTMALRQGKPRFLR